MPSLARNWFFSSSSGNNGNWFNSAVTPWKSLSELRARNETVQPGDTINLKCGDVWRESLDFDKTWIPANVTLQSWPVDCSDKPSVRGSDVKATVSWQAGGSTNVYKTAWAGVNAPAQLFVNGEQFVLARYPNANGNPNNYALAETGSGPGRSLTLSAADRGSVPASASDLTGARVLLRSQQWLVEPRTVTNYVGSTGVLTFDQVTQHGPQAKDGFVLENKRWMIDSAREWFYDSAGWLYAQPATGTNLSTSNIELTVRPHIVRVTEVSGFTVRNIDLRHAKVNALQIIDSPNATVDRVTVAYAGVAGTDCLNTGVYIGPPRNGIVGGCAGTSQPSASAGAKVTSSVFSGNGESSIYVESPNAKIEANQIADSGLLAFNSHTLAAVRVKGAGASIKGNAITRSAYNAIEFGNAGEVIDGNVVNTYCVRYADCGAIYAYNGGAAQTSPIIYTQGPSSITNNYIVVGTGNLQGSSNPMRNLVAGVYLDAFSNNVTISGNAIDEAGIGIYLNGAYKNTIQNNWVKGARRAGLLVSDGVGGGGYARANTVSGNRFHAYNRFVWVGPGELPLRDAGVAQEWYQKSVPSALFADDASIPAPRNARNAVSGNVAVNADSKTSQWRVASSNTDYFSHDLSLGTWKSTALATDTLQPIWPVRLVWPLGSGQASTGTALVSSDFSNSLSPWFMQNGPANGGGTLISVPGMAGTPGAACTTNCAGISFLSDTNAYYNGEFNVSSSGLPLYYLTYMVAGADGSMAGVNVRYNGWEPGFDVKEGTKSHELGTGVAGENETRWFEGIFKPQVPMTSAALVVDGRAGTSIALDEVKLVQYTALSQFDLYTPSPNARLVYNMTDTTMTVNCPFTGCSEWKDETGMVLYAGSSVSVPPGGKKMLFHKPSGHWLRP